MMHIEYTINDIKNNMKSNKKNMIVIIVSFVLIGICVGALQSIDYKQQKYTLDDTIVEYVFLDENTKDETYYYKAFNEIKEKYNSLYAYIQYLKQVSLDNENVKKLMELEEELIKYKQECYDEISLFYTSEKPIICNDYETTKEYLTDNIEKKDRAIETYEENLKILNSHSFSKLFVDSSESKIYESIKTAEREKEFWEDYLDILLTTDSEKIEKNNKKMDQWLTEGKEGLNKQVVAFNNFIGQVEKQEQYDIIYNKYLLKSYLSAAGVTGELSEEDILNNRKSNAIIYAESISGLDMPKERFLACFTFFALVGIMIAVLYGSFFTTRKHVFS